MLKQKLSLGKDFVKKYQKRLLVIIVGLFMVFIVFNFLSFIFVLYSLALFLLISHVLLEIIFEALIESLLALEPVGFIVISIFCTLLIYLWYWLAIHSEVGKLIINLIF